MLSLRSACFSGHSGPLFTEQIGIKWGWGGVSREGGRREGCKNTPHAAPSHSPSEEMGTAALTNPNMPRYDMNRNANMSFNMPLKMSFPLVMATYCCKKVFSLKLKSLWKIITFYYRQKKNMKRVISCLWEKACIEVRVGTKKPGYYWHLLEKWHQKRSHFISVHFHFSVSRLLLC